MDLNKISQIEFSKRDNKRNIRLPSSLNEDLSELTGILIGDGHLSCPCKKRAIKRTPYQVIVSGSLSEDWDYFHTVTNKIFLKNFNVKLRVVKHKNSNCFGAVVDSKAIFCYFTRILKIPSGRKSEIAKIPTTILNSNKGTKLAFIRGISDTDFCLTFKKGGRKAHTYPVIKGKFKSHVLVEQLHSLLRSVGFRCVIVNDDYYDKRFKKTNNEKTLQLSGKENLERWMSLIGFKNLRHYTKYLIWKKFGFCPPNTNLEQRKKILEGD